MSHSASNHSVGRTQRAVRHKHVIQAVHIQWRALLLAVIACLTVLFYWVRKGIEKNHDELTFRPGHRFSTLRKSAGCPIYPTMFPFWTAGYSAWSRLEILKTPVSALSVITCLPLAWWWLLKLWWASLVSGLCKWSLYSVVNILITIMTFLYIALCLQSDPSLLNGTIWSTISGFTLGVVDRPKNMAINSSSSDLPLVAVISLFGYLF